MTTDQKMHRKLLSLSVFICLHLWLITLLPSVASAHVARMTSATAAVSPDGRVKLSITLDVLSYSLNDTSERVPDDAMNALLDGPESDLRGALADARDRLLRAAHFQNGTTDSVTFPTVDDIHAYLKTDPRPRLPVTMTATVLAHLPTTSTTFSLRLPEVLGTVVLTVERPGDEPVAVASDPGRWSDPVPIHLSLSNQFTPGHSAAPDSSLHIPFHKTLLEFIKLGFTHIIPEGLDHILFVLGLFLLSTNLNPLLAQVTAFTLAHSLTLGLSLYGVIHLPSSVVEPLIALSIAFIAIENLFTSKLNPWRPAIVFAFGLVHGLGFAGILHDLSLPRSQFLPALVGFNLGVETGQLAVIAAAFLLVGWFRPTRWYRPAIAIPASLLIAATGLFWTVQRIVAP